MKWELRWHDAKSDPPKKVDKYLCIVEYSGGHRAYSVESWSKDLYKVDEWDFGKCRGKSGWYGYDSEYGYFEIDNVVKWAELPKIPEE